LTGLCARRAPEYAGRDEGIAPLGAEQKDGRDQSTPFGLRKWWVRKSEHTWVRFRERRGLAHALCDAWYVYWAIEGLKSARKTLRSAEEVLAISNEQGFPLWSAVGNIMRGWCLGAVGQAAEGIPLLLQGLAILRAAGCNVLSPFFFTTLAEIYGMAGEPVEGLNRLAEAATLVEATQERWAEAEMHRLRGMLLLSVDEYAAAENSFHHALSVARRQSAKFWELRAAVDLARLWRDQGKRAEARNLLAPIYGWFTEGFDTPVPKEAKALLDELT
jgi:predicted ATPase